MAYSLSYSKAILVLAFISDKISREETDYISAKTISELLNIPRPTLALIFNNLVRAGILDSKEGIHGGVRFAKAPKDITLHAILLAIESPKPLFQTNFDIRSTSKRPMEIQVRLKEKLLQAENTMKEELKKATLQDILT
ncbi:MAG: Rrf2 family transcriptional regulator [Crocinitomicaceae bacterium]|nr:Rrf2 family transcriptional regulator [Crocinitomicaceae bacterium]